MIFEKLYNYIKNLESLKGNDKIKYLDTVIDDPNVVWLLKSTLDQGFSYNISDIPPFEPQQNPATEQELINTISWVRNQPGLSDQDRAAIHSRMCTSEAAYEIASRIFRKDLRCGIAAKTVNKLRKNLVFITPYQRCSDYSRIDKMTFPALLQLKANGMFSYLMPDGSFLTRQGQSYTIQGNQIAPTHQNSTLRDKIIIQELLVLDDNGKPLPRAVGNGIINSFIKGSGDIRHVANIVSRAWGFVTKEDFQAKESSAPYSEIHQTLVSALSQTNKYLQPIKTVSVSSLSEAQQIVNTWIASGEEGGVLKSLSHDFIWKGQDSCDFQIKMKAEAEAEFVIVDAYPGEKGKKYENYLGGLTVRSSDFLILTDVGGGFTDAQRKLGLSHWKSKVGGIITAKFNGITESADSALKALDHPRFVEERFDKDEADTLEYCINALLKGK